MTGNETHPRYAAGRRLPAERLEDRVLLSTYLVTNTADAGAGSLRQAITDANRHVGADVIQFRIGTGGAKTIAPRSGLPYVTDPVTLDATTQPGYAGRPLMELSGSLAGSGAVNGLAVSAGNSTVKGLAINRFSGFGILLYQNGNNVVTGNYVGTDLSGSAAAGNRQHGVIVQSKDNRIERNVVSANGGAGVYLYTGLAGRNRVAGNFVGTDRTGTKRLGNKGSGVHAYGSWGNTIGGTTATARNVISANAADGVLVNGTGANGNVILGNHIGLDAAGAAALGNGMYGVEISQANNTVGGTAAGSRNVISANAYSGVVLYLSTGSNNVVQGNYIGTDATGAAVTDLGNAWKGVEITNGAKNNLVGGTTAAARNVISNNNQGGVGIYSRSSGNRVEGNYIGTDATGTRARGNTLAGVVVTDSAGANTVAGNVISANSAQGVMLTSGTGPTTLQGNKIGTDVTGKLDFGNWREGVFVMSSNNVIGGNLVSGNNAEGIRVQAASGNRIQGNKVGTDATGTTARRNLIDGIALVNASNTLIQRNTVAFNAGNGILVGSGTGNRIEANSVFSNDALGINLNWNLVSYNDLGDADTGPNNTQNFPVLASVRRSGTSTLVAGTLNSKPNTTYRLEFFATPEKDAHNHGEGKTYLGSTTLTTNAAGNATFTAYPSGAAAGSYITATATSPTGDTSEFARAVQLPLAGVTGTNITAPAAVAANEDLLSDDSEDDERE